MLGKQTELSWRNTIPWICYWISGINRTERWKTNGNNLVMEYVLAEERLLGYQDWFDTVGDISRVNFLLIIFKWLRHSRTICSNSNYVKNYNEYCCWRACRVTLWYYFSPLTRTIKIIYKCTFQIWTPFLIIILFPYFWQVL